VQTRKEQMRRHDPACLRSSNGKITPADAIREPDPQSAVRLDLMPDGWCRAICSVTLAQKQTAAAPQRGTAQQTAPRSRPRELPPTSRASAQIVNLYRPRWAPSDAPQLFFSTCGTFGPSKKFRALKALLRIYSTPTHLARCSSFPPTALRLL
jgi:hypothetical protein